MRPVLSTYRLQLRGDCFTFADAEALLDYLAELGVSHLYLSPILTATRGSTHGYDVTDPTTVSAELGGPDGLAALAAAAHRRGLGLIVDIVPNHVGVEVPEQNPWWWDVLMHGRASAYAEFFDIDWSADPDGRILLPVLGSADDVEALTVDGDRLRLGERSFPIAPGTGSGTGAQVHDRQHYRLTDWRTGVCGYRRFFSITSLAGLRQEDPRVFEASHREVRRWFEDGLVDGLRIDHPDGLTDPGQYLTRLRELIGPDAYLVVEKILAVDETLDPGLPVQGSTGYDALREIGGLFLDPAGAPALTALAEQSGFPAAVPALLADCKRSAARDTLGSELARLCRAVTAGTGRTHPLLTEAITELLTRVPVYRSDYRGLDAVLPTALAETAAAAPQLAEPLAVLVAGLQQPEPAARLQQLCGAMTAKAVEDQLFYRDPRLVSLNEVGGEPDRFGVGLAEFHQAAAQRARHWPSAMITLSTHDTKRGEDVRARIGVLSQVPGLWTELVADWAASTPCPDPATGLFLCQNFFGVWPENGAVDDELRTRLHGYTEKAIRESGVHTAWSEPDTEFEAAMHTWVDEVLDGPVGAGLSALTRSLAPHAHNDALGQKLLALTVPGVPDVYQGTELWEDSLVDPDNRRPVDYAAQRAALAAGTHPKLAVVRAALRLRRERPDTFLAGGYTPLLADGTSSGHLVAFGRGADVVVAATRHSVHLAESGWGDTALRLPPGSWTDRIGDRRFEGRVLAEQLFTPLPVALLVRDDD